MDYFQAYLPFFQLVALAGAGVIFFRYFQEQNAIMQILIICAAAYLATIVLEKDPGQFINRFLQGMF
jgi:hypothetical protein